MCLKSRMPQDEMFPIGIRVELMDLKAIAHMNGRRGTVCETPEENIGRPELAGRISVSLLHCGDCDVVVAIRDSHLALCRLTFFCRLSWTSRTTRAFALCTCALPI